MRRLEMTLEVDACNRSEAAAIFIAPWHSCPSDVVRDPSLCVAEKRAILADWASDARAPANLPTYRQLDDGTLVQVGEILEALNALDEATEHVRPMPWTARRSSKAANARWIQRILRRRRDDDDDDDDPPPLPARMPRPRPRNPGAEAVSLFAA